jgi:general secretion pathway protein E
MPKNVDTILAEILTEKGLIDHKSLESLLKETDSSGKDLQELLIQKNLFLEMDLLNLLADKLKLTRVNLKEITVGKPVLDKVPMKIASYYRFMPVAVKGRVLIIAVSTYLDVKLQDEIRTQLGYDLELVLSPENDIVESLKKYYGLAAETMEKIVSMGEAVSQKPQEAVEDIGKLAADASVIRLVNQIILEGWKKRATDIHIEPYREGVSLRYRIDGLLYDAPVPPEFKDYLNAVISRIKIMSNLNIVERRLPQDGRAIVRVQEQVLDLRISTIPTPFGESIVIRLLPTQMLFSLEKLGLSRRYLQVFETLIKLPHGIVFVTGPTGSGKTTTLYACLSRINTKERKIITIEDPIEYEMSGITQIQVQPEIGLDFARGLRSILRHDPDVIMVGEVRDLETAEIAIRVALTGHLVFSTLHTNDAASGVTRLIDIGVEPYLISSSVVAFIAQRLVRTICQDCKQDDKSIPEELKVQIARELGLKSASDVKVSRGKGCPTCNFTGFFGRTSLYEVLLIDEEIKDLIVKKVPSGQIKKMALSKGMQTLRQDGWQKVIVGSTTPEEVMKVTSVEETAESEKNAYGANIGFLEEKAALPGVTDQRTYLRLISTINIRYKIFKSEGDLLKRGFTPEQLSVTKNISAGGLLFIADEKLSVGSILELKIELPDAEEPIESLVRVIRVEALTGNSYDIAICFLDITSAQRARLNRYVEKEKD